LTKIAIFVEGRTEREFVKKLVGQRYGYMGIKVEEISLRGKDSFIHISPIRNLLGLSCFFFIVEVPSYDKVPSYINDNASNLVNTHSFRLLSGLQDLIPRKRSDKRQVIASIKKFLKNVPERDKISITLAVMETEAWFLCDWHMFQRIDTRLTTALIQSNLGLDLVNDDPELAYDHPSRILDDILRLAQRRYRKHFSEIRTVIGNLDVSYLSSCTSKIDSFFRFISELDSRIPKSHTAQKKSSPYSLL